MAAIQEAVKGSRAYVGVPAQNEVLPLLMLQALKEGKVPAAAAAGDLPAPLDTDNLDSDNNNAKYVLPSSQLSRSHLIRRVYHACQIRVDRPHEMAF